MIRSVNELRSYAIAATDGTVGTVHDIFFDDHAWQARYIVADTGTWLVGRRVLVSPQAVAAVDAVGKSLSVRLTKQEIREGPGIDADAPVSRQNEIALADHFRRPRYWEEFPSGAGLLPVIPHLQPQPGEGMPTTTTQQQAVPRGDPDLRSAAEVAGYHVAARDGDIGHVEDFLVEDSDWSLRFLIIDTRNWLPGRKVLVAPAWTQGIDWSDEKLLVDADRDTIKSAPEYEVGKDVDQALERRIFQHYGREAAPSSSF